MEGDLFRIPTASNFDLADARVGRIRANNKENCRVERRKSIADRVEAAKDDPGLLSDDRSFGRRRTGSRQ